MSARRALELRPVPEYDRLSNIPVNPATSSTPRAGNLARSGLGAAGSGGGGGTEDAAREGASAGASGSGPSGPSGPSLSHMSSARYGRNQSARQTGGLGRTSLVLRLRGQLADFGKLQANWLNYTLVKRSAEQDYVNEEDQGFVSLVARHVSVNAKAWLRLQDVLGAEGDGQFWGTTYDPFKRGSVRASLQDQHENEGEGAEEGKAKEAAKRKPRPSIFGLTVIQPYNLFAVLWSMAMLLLDLTYTAFWVPMNVAFCTAQYGKWSSGCTTSDLIGGIFYFMNTLLGFQIGLVATNGFRKRTVVDGRMVAWLYVRFGRFWLDLLASLPFVYLVVVLALRPYTHLEKAWINCLSLLRLLRMLRLVSISKVVYFDSLSGRFQESRLGRFLSVTVVYSVFLAYQLAVALNLFACIMVLCAYFEGYDNSWMTSVDWVNVPNASPIYQWYCAVYWMIVTATTTGFGDFQPRSLAEQVVANVVMMGGMIMFGVLVAAVGNALSRATAEAHQAYASRQKILHVMEWAEHRGLPTEIRKQVQNYYADKYGRKEEDTLDAAVMLELPSRLRAKVARHMAIPLVTEVHLLMDLPEDVMALLSENMRPLRLPAGEDLCQQGDVASCFWILQEGTVQAVRYREGNETIDASSSPALIGESVLLGEALEACRVRPWTLRTVTPCRLWGITLAELYPLMRMYPVIGMVAAEYVKFKTLALLKGTGDDGHWCELAAVIARQLREHADEEEVQDLIRDLTTNSAFHGTVQPVLERVLAFCAARRGGQGQGIPPPTGAPSNRQPPQRGASETLGPRDAAAAPDKEQAQTPPPPPPPQQQQQQPALQALTTQPSQGLPRVQAPAQPPNGLGAAASVAAPHPPTAASSSTVFGTPAAAAALAAALQALASGGLEAAAAAPGTATATGTDGALPYGPAQGGVPPGPVGASAVHTTAHPNAYAGIAAATAGGAAAGASAVQCFGCQRCICPSCGQGMDPAAAPAGQGAAGSPAHGGNVAAAAAAAAAAALLQHGVNTKTSAIPAIRAWMNRGGTLRRVSIGVRQDQVWAAERRSFDRRQLGAMSVAPFYE